MGWQWLAISINDHTPHTLFMEQYFNTAAKSQDMSSIGVEPEYGFTSIFCASSPFSQCYITFSTCVLPTSLHQVELSLHMLPILTLSWEWHPCFSHWFWLFSPHSQTIVQYLGVKYSLYMHHCPLVTRIILVIQLIPLM